MKLKLSILAAAVLAFLDARPTAAVVIGFTPASQSVAAGSPLTVDLVVSGLADNAAPSLGTFDLDVSFDPLILSFNGTTFGNQLDLFGLGDINAVTPGVGTVNLFELSLESATDLDTLQLDSFVLATLTFDTVGNGVSPLGISVNTLGDSMGDPLSADVATGRIESLATVPEPPTMALVGLGLLSSLAFRRKRNETR